MSFVNRKLYKQKPQAWGPVSAVKASIFKNAERMGIDPRLSTNTPFWEMTGRTAYNYGTLAGNGVINPASTLVWNKNYLDSIAYSVNAPMVSFNSDDIISTSTPFFCFARVYISNFTGWDFPGVQTIKCSDGQAFRWGFGNYANYYGVICGSSADWIPIETQESGIAGKWHTVIVSYNGQGAGTLSNFKIFDNGVKKTLDVSGTFGVQSNVTAIGNSSGTVQNLNGLFDFVTSFIGSDIRDDTAFELSDNPYFLLHRVPPVFYSVPGGAVIPTFNPLLLNAAQPTRVIQ